MYARSLQPAIGTRLKLLSTAILVLTLLALAPTQPAAANDASSPRSKGHILLESGSTQKSYDVKATIADHTSEFVDIALHIKHRPGSDRFFLSEQNYRLRYDDEMFDFWESTVGGDQTPYIVNLEGHLNGVLEQDGQPDSFYTATITGSTSMTVGTPPTISFNVELAAGPGFLISDQWYEVGRVRLYFDEPSLQPRQISVHWNTDEDFPPTYVSWKDPTTNSLVTADGLYFYGIYELSPSNICCSYPVSEW